MTPPDRLRVFVYGTLKPGEENYDRYCKTKVVEIQEAIVFGQLFDLPDGYPAMILGDCPVYGFVFSFADLTVLDELDELEEYNPHRPLAENEYIRQEIEAFTLEYQSLGPVWIYLMDLELIKRMGGVLLPNGQWTSG